MKNKMVQNMMKKMEMSQAARKKAVKLTAAALCAALALGGAGTAVYVQAAEGRTAQETAEIVESASGSADVDADTTKGAGDGADTDTADSKVPGQDAGAAQEEEGPEGGVPNGGGSGSDGKTGKTGFGQGDGKLSKEETVYVLAGADGNTQKIIVSDWLKNGTGADSLEDVSELIHVENVSGDEGYTSGADNSKVWDARGEDIYYQGNIEKELPISMKVTYKLDGKEISPAELAGKSGKVTIRFDYTNEQYEYTQVNGVRTKIYVPFAVVTGMLLDDEVFTNVEVSGGKLVNDGGRTMVMGFALPGLQENLAIDSEKLDLPEYFEVTADVRDFEMAMTATIATNELFNGVDIDDEDIVGELNEALEELTDAMEQLEDGSSALYDGLCTLLDKSGELISGIDKLSDGASQLRDGIGTLDGGAAKLQDGTAKLQSGLNTLVSKNGELNGGARQVFDTLLSTARTQLIAAGLDVPALTVENYAEVLNGVIASLDGDAVYQQAYGQVTAAVEANRGQIETGVTAAVREQVAAKVTAGVREQVAPQVTEAAREKVAVEVIKAAAGMSKGDYDAAVAAGLVDEATQAAVESAINAQMESDAVKQEIADAINAQMGTPDIQAAIEANIEQQMAGEEVKGIIASNIEAQVQKAISDNMAGETVQGQLAAASEGAKSVIALKASLDNYNVFYQGLQAYTAGVAEAARGAGELKGGVDELRSGTGRLYSGASELYDGIQTMKKAAPALTDGIRQLRDGALKLSDGLREFDEEGIQKLVDAVDGDLDDLIERVRATSEVSRNYRSFSGISDEMEGSVKFIYRTDSIEAEE